MIESWSIAPSPPSPIGGYFELELAERAEYHSEAIRLNTGRNAFEYILRARGYKRVYLPYYTCEVMLQPLMKLGIEWRFYHINAAFEPVFDFSNIQTDEGFVYTNYFGLKDRYVESLTAKYPDLIVDNAQAFFSKRHPKVDVFYSPRKFFGLPDGAYLYTDAFLDDSLEQDHSEQRFEHLLLRAEYEPEDGYRYFVQNSRRLDDLAIKKMSHLTRRLLKGIDYTQVSSRRRANFLTLHEALAPLNKLRFELTDNSVPMVYPFYGGLTDLRQRLIENRIYVAQYWPNVIQWTKPDDLERRYTECIVPLPIDQRYTSDDMKRIIAVLHAVLR